MPLICAPKRGKRFPDRKAILKAALLGMASPLAFWTMPLELPRPDGRQLSSAQAWRQVGDVVRAASRRSAE